MREAVELHGPRVRGNPRPARERLLARTRSDQRWRLHHQAIPGGECRGMWPDCYSRQQASVIRRQWNSEAVTLPRRDRLNRTLSRSSAVLSRRNRYSSPRPDRINDSSSHYGFFTEIFTKPDASGDS